MASINPNDVKLMLAIIASVEGGIKADNENLAKIIGGGVSANAIRQRVQKIKNQAKAVLNGEEIDMGAKASATPKSAGSAKRKNVPASATASDGEGDEETPAKKKRGPSRAIGASVGKAKGGRNTKRDTKSEEADIKVEDAAALQIDGAPGDDAEI